MDRVLEVKDLRVCFDTPHGVAKAVDGVSFHIERGEIFALVGESGCGKTLTALSVIQLLPEGARVGSGSIVLSGRDILKLDEYEKRTLRGDRVSMVFQEPMTSLNPVFTIGEQIVETILAHRDVSKKDAKDMAVELLRKVRLPRPEALFDEYPHRLSGGMRQRVMIAIAIALKPDLLIADEPTTALDVTVQEEILRLLGELKEEFNTSVLLITHNLALVYRNAQRVAVMYGGNIVESAPSKELFKNPMHPYTWQLLRAVPDIKRRGRRLTSIPGVVPPAYMFPEGCRFSGRCPREMKGCNTIKPELKEIERGHILSCHLYNDEFLKDKELSTPIVAQKPEEERPATEGRTEGAPILEVKGLKCYYPVRKGVFKRVVGYVKAVDGIELTIKEGSTVALVGESGCGKTTAGKAIIRLLEPTDGKIMFMGKDITHLPERELKPLRRKMQIVFQDPYSSLNPRLTAHQIVEEGLSALMPEIDAKERLEKIKRVFRLVGLTEDMLGRYPHEFSGGQRQRLSIARALVVEPRFIVCDEATSALDVSVQAQILNLLKSIQKEFSIALLFITHDLGVVEYMADEVAVMKDGRIVEYGTVEELLTNPQHPYTKTLLSCVPKIDVDVAGEG